MIAGIFHEGSGLGNQLFRYVATRVLAEDKGYDWGMYDRQDGSGKESGFKGASFMQGDWYGKAMKSPYHLLMKDWHEKKVVENGVDIRSYDPEFNFIEDNTLIDGEFQDERYFGHRLYDIGHWLKTDNLEIDDDLCVIGFRGGEYTAFPDLFLTSEYWDTAMYMMRLRNPNMAFEVHTDDPDTARKFFPYPIIHDIGINWRSMRYAKYAIIANSSFYILPRLLSHREHVRSRTNPVAAVTIAPRYWARRNTRQWALPQNYYKDFIYI